MSKKHYSGLGLSARRSIMPDRMMDDQFRMDDGISCDSARAGPTRGSLESPKKVQPTVETGFPAYGQTCCVLKCRKHPKAYIAEVDQTNRVLRNWKIQIYSSWPQIECLLHPILQLHNVGLAFLQFIRLFFERQKSGYSYTLFVL